MKENSKIAVLGGGESGSGAAVLAKKKGHEVFLSDSGTIKPKYKKLLDSYGIEWEENGHNYERILKSDEIIKSPGIPENSDIILKARALNIPTLSEIEFAGRYNTAKTICITGSNGKTTTTMLTYHILEKAGYNVGLAGNVGKSFALQVAENNFDYYVIELSSFQLDNMYDFKADIAVLLNITPDHLDRYEYKFVNYMDSKMRITRNQTDKEVFIYWNDDENIRKELEKFGVKAKKEAFSLNKETNSVAYLDNGKMLVNTQGQPFEMSVSDIALSGTHNIYNSMAATLSAKAMNVKNETIREALSDFEGVPHRLQKIAKVKGVLYVNDSKATNVNSCWYALESMTTPVVLILGGKDKGNNYDDILSLIKEKVRFLVFMGKDNSKLETYFAGIKPFVSVNSMEAAVKECYKHAEIGDTVLLSPCCASFDLFNNYEDRGEQFANCVRNL